MKRITFSIFTFFLGLTLHAQDITGAWAGALSINNNSLPLVLHISNTNGKYGATMDSPAQGVKAYPVDQVEYINGQLKLAISSIGLEYTAKFRPDSNLLDGTFKQSGLTMQLKLNRSSNTDAAPGVRPQDPKSFPYKREEISFRNNKAGITLRGTLTLPSDSKATKIAILISGSGPQNRDSEFPTFNHRPFLVWSDWLTRQGIAVLRFDDRGIAKSEGVFAKATTADFATDVEAAIAYVRSRQDLKSLKLGLIGHSEGGMIAPMIASHDKSVQFLVLLAAPGVPFADLLMKQQADIARSNGIAQDKIDDGITKNKEIFESYAKYKTLDSAAFAAKLKGILMANFKPDSSNAMSASQRNAAINSTINLQSSAWFRYAMNFIPATYLSRVQCPVLSLNGSLDLQVAATENLDGIRKNLDKAGNKRHREVLLPGLNHMFQQAKTGNPLEYSQLQETVNPQALKEVSSWINSL